MPRLAGGRGSATEGAVWRSGRVVTGEVAAARAARTLNASLRRVIPLLGMRAAGTVPGARQSARFLLRRNDTRGAIPRLAGGRGSATEAPSGARGVSSRGRLLGPRARASQRHPHCHCEPAAGVAIPPAGHACGREPSGRARGSRRDSSLRRNDTGVQCRVSQGAAGQRRKAPSGARGVSSRGRLLRPAPRGLRHETFCHCEPAGGVAIPRAGHACGREPSGRARGSRRDSSLRRNDTRGAIPRLAGGRGSATEGAVWRSGRVVTGEVASARGARASQGQAGRQKRP